MQYRRARAAGGTFFFTLVTHDRRRFLCEPENVALLRTSSRTVPAWLPISVQVKAFILDAAQKGYGVLVPERMVTWGGGQTIAWWQLDLQTGEMVGVGEDGTHQFLVQFTGDALARRRLPAPACTCLRRQAGRQAGRRGVRTSSSRKPVAHSHSVQVTGAVPDLRSRRAGL